MCDRCFFFIFRCCCRRLFARGFGAYWRGKRTERSRSSPCRSPRAIDSRASRLTAAARVREEPGGEGGWWILAVRGGGVGVGAGRGGGGAEWGGSRTHRGHARRRGGRRVPLHAGRWSARAQESSPPRASLPRHGLALATSLFRPTSFPFNFVSLSLSLYFATLPMSMATDRLANNTSRTHAETHTDTETSQLARYFFSSFSGFLVSTPYSLGIALETIFLIF